MVFLFGTLVSVIAVLALDAIGRTGSSSSVPNRSNVSSVSPSSVYRPGRVPHPPTDTSTTRTTATSQGPPWSVRRATIDFYDPRRASVARGTNPAHLGRSLSTTLRWPVSANGRVAPGPHPLVVFAHGYNVSAGTYSAMLDDLTRTGIVVAAPEFPGESSALPGRPVESDLVNEPCDIEFVAQSLERSAPAGLRGVLAHAPLIVAGHSDGATAAASAGYASQCSSVPIRGVVALSTDDVPTTGAFRFGQPPILLAMSGTADEVNPFGHTMTLYQHVPAPAWLVTIDHGSHLAPFTSDADLARVDAMIADFVFVAAYRDPTARARLEQATGGRFHVQHR